MGGAETPKPRQQTQLQALGHQALDSKSAHTIQHLPMKTSREALLVGLHVHFDLGVWVLGFRVPEVTWASSLKISVSVHVGLLLRILALLHSLNSKLGSVPRN